jgi:hypothetical protein
VEICDEAARMTHMAIIQLSDGLFVLHHIEAEHRSRFWLQDNDQRMRTASIVVSIVGADHASLHGRSLHLRTP